MGLPNTQNDICLRGIPVSPGVRFGRLFVLTAEEIAVPRRTIQEHEIGPEIDRLEKALIETRKQILAIQEHLSKSIGEKDASIFDAHLLVIEDSSLIEGVKKQMHTRLLCADYIFYHITQRYAQSMREVEDPYLQERAADILDVSKRVLNNLSGTMVQDKFKLDQPSIILAHDLDPSATADFTKDQVLAFATDLGSRTSHTAIMARSLGIPAVTGLKDASYHLETGTEVVLDGYEGLLIIRPSDQTRFRYGQLEEKRQLVEVGLSELRDTEAITRDNHKIIISANVEKPEDMPSIKEAGAEGVGLYRTEYLYMHRITLPTEEEMISVYRSVIDQAKPDSVIFRTLDVGGDKIADTIPMAEELNPFLGWRAIRYCLEREEVFRTQLRAILRAGAGEHIRIMFPMISTFEELKKAKAILKSVQEGLAKEGLEQTDDFEIGVMMEVPSLALIADHIAPHVDFMSIGTNDLIQYALAVDRTNEKVSYLYQPTHPAIIRLIRRVVEAGHAANVWVGVCGEMAGEVLLTPLLIGLGVDEFSMGPAFIPRVKRAVQRLDYNEMKKLVDGLDQLSTAAEIEAKLKTVASRHYPELMN
ncbi:MAG: phosphoenolpyruvate--protein phosphotransferase [Candidatus Methylacidiphilales bacterium]